MPAVLVRFFYSCIIILLCNEQDEVVLCKQPHLSQEYESITSGFIMPGETAEETAHREVREELGLTLDRMIPEGTYWFSKGQMLMHGFWALSGSSLSGCPRKSPPPTGSPSWTCPKLPIRKPRKM